ncbi:hypothetical protein WH47_01508 [Habropoda laboriosa]|uniref:Uncharacterized protein n=1 Tax=Habropoda laboriosa TaxID=597456 RepID=A0A0L7R0H1_9HYME|nr:hypothetical protein WH47_01508 [Habropoda laboriosa]
MVAGSSLFALIKGAIQKGERPKTTNSPLTLIDTGVNCLLYIRCVGIYMYVYKESEPTTMKLRITK